MFKNILPRLWAFDLEWVPDAESGRRVYNLPDSASDEEVIFEMWKQGGATDEDPQPYLKTVLCRVVSVAAVCRSVQNGEIVLEIKSLPKFGEEPYSEEKLIENFLVSVGKQKPQLVGYNSSEADLPILVQRGIAKGISVKSFCERPEKKWDGGVDYFDNWGYSHIDLKKILMGFGKSTPSLHQIAEVSGIPGKLDTSGQDVISLWRKGDMQAILEYNIFDALTTYLVWLRTAHFSGLIEPDNYYEEQLCVLNLLKDKIAKGENYLEKYLSRWSFAE